MKRKKDENTVVQEVAYLHGNFAAIRNIGAQFSHFRPWAKGRLNVSPQKIYDINGTLLFLDFDVKEGRQELGTIRTAATKLVGTPVVSLRLGPKLWDEKGGREKITAIIKKKHPGFKIIEDMLVCYSYPKIGLMVELQGRDNNTQTLIFDIADYSLIPPKKDDREGAFAWSYLDEMDNKRKTANVKKYDLQTVNLRKAVTDNDLIRMKAQSLEKAFDISKLKLRGLVKRELEFCTHYKFDEAAAHHCFVLHAQQVNDYCAVATCQMILCYYRYYYEQSGMTSALGYTPGDGCPRDTSGGYESLSNNHIKATFDDDATWEKARAQIDQLQPMKSGISGHARAAAGYSYLSEALTGMADRKLYIYDPWPWNADLKAGGAIYWEEWDSISHTNFLFTELDY